MPRHPSSGGPSGGRRGGQQQLTSTYDLSSASARTAFEEGLETNEWELGDNLQPRSRGTNASNQSLIKQRNARNQAAPAWGDDDGYADEGDPSAHLSPQEEERLMALISVFSEQHEPSVIHGVLKACGGSFDAALQVGGRTDVSGHGGCAAHGVVCCTQRLASAAHHTSSSRCSAT